MNLILKRDDQNERRTFGAIYTEEGEKLCETLELPWRNNEINVSCIPAGEYEVHLEFSFRFNRWLYWLKDVPGRGAIEIHVGNTTKDTEGCILVGSERVGDSVRKSKIAFDRFMGFMEGKGFTLFVRDVS
jgi:hypothetical protein